ncbi:hypothetical protein [Ohtaekwangia koreensis]|uniref:Uncharacterized protein n=1 Tax=Ohtaekwangia koreensis TaxID=688867 RepID=A0A1T5LEV5_9BACT|nr:hypothetical protein [Ohtaekwangia koreensis]SKC74523.1 hypothetical protein SAMN05660236_3088 [Ohtaekwangia koreensis]
MANFKPNAGKKSSKKTVDEGIKKFDEKFRKDKNVDTKSIFFGRDALLKMLSEDGSSGITIFLTYQPNPDADNKDTIQLALVPTKEDGTLIWEDESKASAATTALSTAAPSTSVSYVGGVTCPPYCPK